ncbi:O-antigen ligase family protein [Nakamurella flava]|uniref:O-antigen ligase family protein n=1 Tax=Nakamurella flava TaxID=2576308 RepID=A0A4U6QBD7_9ACTN|nr:O-antigen ligase family protein [Nakamurella flava]TKV57354.1 O-antigen ligase family protein [Nakamurella flava]
MPTTMPLVVTILSSVFWVAALLVRRPLRTRRPTIEFWWAWTAMVTAGVVALFSIGVLSGTATLATAVRMIPLIVVGVIMVLQTLAARTLSINWAGGLIGAYFVLLLAFAFGGESVAQACLSLAVFLPAILGRRTGYDLRQIRNGLRLGTLTAIIAIAMIGIAQSSDFFGPCRTDKCSVWGLSIGTAGDGNALGIFYAIAAALCLLIIDGRWKFLVISTASLALVDLTSSRTALYSWIIGIVVAIVDRWCRRTNSNLMQAVTAIALGATCVILPLLAYRGDEFTYRATLWLSARGLAAESPLVGYGSSFWVRLGGEDGISANYSTHNLMMESLVASGAIGCLLLAGALTTAVLSAQDDSARRWSLGVVCVLLSGSLTEVISAPGRPYLFPALAVLALLAVSYTPDDPESHNGSQCPNRAARGNAAAAGHPRSRVTPVIPGPGSGAASQTGQHAVR